MRTRSATQPWRVQTAKQLSRLKRWTPLKRKLVLCTGTAGTSLRAKTPTTNGSNVCSFYDRRKRELRMPLRGFPAPQNQPHRSMFPQYTEAHATVAQEDHAPSWAGSRICQRCHAILFWRQGRDKIEQVCGIMFHNFREQLRPCNVRLSWRPCGKAWRGHWAKPQRLSLDSREDLKMLQMPGPWNAHQEELQAYRVGLTQKRGYLYCKELRWRVGATFGDQPVSSQVLESRAYMLVTVADYSVCHISFWSCFDLSTPCYALNLPF